MKIAFCYPPFSKGGRFPNLPQNRQFIYTASKAVKLYPVVMATAATWLRNLGHEVLWLDGITRRLDWGIYERNLSSFYPDLLVLETKAPIMKKLWQYINKIKNKKTKVKIVLVGDHVTYFPEESFKNSQIDFILTGGDYDFLLVNLVEHLEKGKELEPGIYFRDKAKVENTGRFRLDHDLDETPILDRNLTRWCDYGEAYLYRPCAYIMSGRGCGRGISKVGVCTFCVWQHSLWARTARLRSPRNVVEEIKLLVELYGVREIFDDTEAGPIWNTEWLREFHHEMHREALLGRVILSTNARADALDDETCALLKRSGFRLLKVGLESGNEETLRRLGKMETLEQIKQGVKTAKDHRLVVMLTTMVGYPWETEEEARQTYEVARELMLYKTRAGDSLQSSIIIPYPGTPLHGQARKNGWLLYGDDYEKYDMSVPVLKTQIDTDKWCRKMWQVHYEPMFLLGSLITIRSSHDVALLLRGVRSLWGHVKDYQP